MLLNAVVVYWAGVTATRQGGGFVVYLSGSTAGADGEGRSGTWVLQVPPGGAARMCFPAPALRGAAVIGASADGSELYLRRSRWLIRESIPSGATSQWALPSDVRDVRAIPSPDGRLVALSTHLRYQMTVRVWSGVHVLDTAAGEVKQVTSRKDGRAADDAVAWSADHPGRLFFVDNRGTLWQLDLNIGR